MKNLNLVNARKAKGFTQKNMADMLAMEQTTYSKKENGQTRMREDEWIRIANILNCDIEILRQQSLMAGDVLYNLSYKDYILISKNVLNFYIEYSALLEQEIALLKSLSNL